MACRTAFLKILPSFSQTQSVLSWTVNLLTLALSKLPEHFIVRYYILPSPRAVISMILTWASATDATGAAVRIVLSDYKKAFDLIGHNILASKKIYSNRLQRVKLSNDCFSEWGSVQSGVPQGTKLAPWLFLMINNLKQSQGNLWKYVGDTTLAEVFPRNGKSKIQSIGSDVEEWSKKNKLQLNPAKCKEMIVDFKKVKHKFTAISINSKELE